MSIENFKKEFIKYGVDNGYIKKPKRPKKDNSKKGDIFTNCRSCEQYIRGDWRSSFDARYCKDCL